MRYFFDLKNFDGGFTDRSGVEFPDGAAAADYARLLAEELIRNREMTARHWRIHVRDEDGDRIAEIRFLDQDRTLDHLKALSRRTMEEISQWRYELGQAVTASRLTRRTSEAIIARSRGKPHLIFDHGEPV